MTASSTRKPSWYEEDEFYAYEEADRRSSARMRGEGSSASQRRQKENLLSSFLGGGNREEAAQAQRKRSSQEDRRRERTKARAERMYSKQFAGDSEVDAPAEGAPRAAVYEGQMGAKHRKSARMQRASMAGLSSFKAGMSSWVSSIPVTPRALKVGTTVLCAFLFCTLLYGPAQQYYQAQREHDKLVAEYSAIENRNEALDEQNDILASDAGMEDAVRQKYGYVKAGEEVAYVAGLSDEASKERRDSDDLQANVLSSTVKAPDEWYTPLLDTFFGVE